MRSSVQVLELPTISDPIEALLRLYRGLRTLWNFLDEGEKEVERFNGGRPVCVEKCGICCQRTPLVSMLEVSYMLGYLHSHGPIREAAFSWVKTPNVKLKAQGVPYGQVLNGEPLAVIQADSLVLQKSPCPFLSLEMRCQVHAFRPLTCRAYGVTSVPDGWCPRPLTAHETPDGRMLIGRGTPLGVKIAASTVALWTAMRYMERADLAVVGFLPMLTAEALALFKVKELQSKGLIQTAKMGKGSWVMPDLFEGQPQLTNKELTG